jgi:HB1, ASXL, restriction endonuclease HTH domain
MTEMDGPQLEKWEISLRHRLENLRGQRKELEIEIEKLSKKLDLIGQMRLIESQSTNPESASATLTERRSSPAEVREWAKKILSESSRPLHISEIHKIFLEKGYPIPGGGTPFNILAHLVNDRDFVRVARGTYALQGTVPVDSVLPKKSRKSRRRKRARRKQIAVAEGGVK